MELLKRKTIKSINGYLENLKGYFPSEVAQEKFFEDMFVKLFNEKIMSCDKDIRFKMATGGGQTNAFKNVGKYLYYNNIDIKSFSSKFEGKMEEDDFVMKKTDELFREMDFSVFNEEELKEIFLECIEVVYKNKRQETRTSKSLNKLISGLIGERENIKIYDPAIGTGNLILQALKNIQEVKVFGQDIDENKIKVCKMNLLLHGRIDDVKNIYVGNTILNPKNLEGGSIQKFECIVCNPPLALKFFGYDEIAKGDYFNRFHRGLPLRGSGDYAFITHIVESLKDNGLAVVVVPLGVLFKGGRDGIIRRRLIEENLIDGVIQLPINMLSGTSISINLLIIRRNKESNSVIFIDGTKEFYTYKKENILPDESIERIVHVYKNRLSVEGFSCEVNEEGIRENDYVLSVQNYVQEVRGGEVLNIEEVLRDMKECNKRIREIELELESRMERQIELNTKGH